MRTIDTLLQLEDKLSAQVRDLQGAVCIKQAEAQREQQLQREDEAQVNKVLETLYEHYITLYQRWYTLVTETPADTKL